MLSMNWYWTVDPCFLQDGWVKVTVGGGGLDPGAFFLSVEETKWLSISRSWTLYSVSRFEKPPRITTMGTTATTKNRERLATRVRLVRRERHSRSFGLAS